MKKYILFFLGSLILTVGITKVILDRRDYVKPEEPVKKEATCPDFQPEYRDGKVSYYDKSYCEKHNPNCRTASGELFFENSFTAACSYDYTFGTNLRIHYKDKSVVVRCNDRGNFEKYGRVADLSKRAFEALASKRKGELEVKIEVVRSGYEMLNEYRENNGQYKLKRSPELEQGANRKAKDIYDGIEPFEHEGYQAYIEFYYGDYEVIAENLAKKILGIYDFDEVISAWHKSEGHKANMLSDEVCDVGIGEYGSIWVLHMARGAE